MHQGVVGENKRRGERGQPCLTPREMLMCTSVSCPKKGETLTSVSEQRTEYFSVWLAFVFVADGLDILVTIRAALASLQKCCGMFIDYDEGVSQNDRNTR